MSKVVLKEMVLKVAFHWHSYNLFGKTLLNDNMLRQFING